MILNEHAQRLMEIGEAIGAVMRLATRGVPHQASAKLEVEGIAAYIGAKIAGIENAANREQALRYLEQTVRASVDARREVLVKMPADMRQ